jgi:phosphate transport system substrate-binding protein
MRPLPRPRPIAIRALIALGAASLFAAAGCGGDTTGEPTKADLGPAVARTAAGEILVRIQGGSTWEEILRPHLADIEARAGVKVDLVASDSWRGLCNVAEGRADIAAVSSPFDQAVAEAEQRRPGVVPSAALHRNDLKPIEVAFVTHASNKVKKLSIAQIKDIFTGRITGWKQVGGADLPIRVVLPGKGDGMRAEVRRQLLDGAELARDAREEERAAQVKGTVSSEPRAIGWVSTDGPHDGLNRLEITGGPATVQLPLFLVTAAEPTPEVRRVLDAVAALRDTL